MNLNKPSTSQSLLAQAEEFRTAYNLQTTGKTARPIQFSLIVEEFEEFANSCGMSFTQLEEYDTQVESDENQLNELADLVFVCFQYAASQDWDLDEAMRRVHRANMSKLGEDGKPIYRGDGKVLKGPNFKKAEFKDLI